MLDIEGKGAFVTGGASGIGLGIAEAMVDAGMKVVIADMQEDYLGEALRGFRQRGRGESVHGLLLDVTDRAAFERAADEAEGVFGKIHVLSANAGVGILGPVKDAKYGDWDWALGVMIGGVVNALQVFLPRILRHGEGGHIVATSSMSGVLPLPGTAIYSTAKGAVVALCEALRGELAPDKVGISAFCPGPVATRISRTGRLRPEKYRKESGYAEMERRIENRPAFLSEMSPGECGRRVLDGIRRDDLYIFTHREFREGVAEKMEAMLASFPDEPVDGARAKEFAFLTSNPIFREILERKGRA